MKKCFFILVLIFFSLSATARHVAGGELMYEYVGPGSDGNSSVYKVTLRLFRDSLSNGPLLSIEQVYVGFYVNGSKVGDDLYLPIDGAVRRISLNVAAFPCLVGNVSASYEVATYSATITLPN